LPIYESAHVENDSRDGFATRNLKAIEDDAPDEIEPAISLAAIKIKKATNVFIEYSITTSQGRFGSFCFTPFQHVFHSQKYIVSLDNQVLR
jgi:hypothetical protein